MPEPKRRAPFPFAVLAPIAAAALAGLSGCGDLEVRSVRSPEVVPAILEGEWRGSWSSARNAGTGPLTLTVQEFDRTPLVALDIDNPCVAPRPYRIVLRGSTFELRDGDDVVLAAMLAPDGTRQLLGTYSCVNDSGTWTAIWQRDLPPLIDLSGAWTGEVTAAGPGGVPVQRDLTLQLTQSVRDGRIVLDGELALPQLLPVLH